MMKKKINKNLIFLTILAIVITTVLLVSSFYDFHFSTEKQHIKNYSRLIAESIEGSDYRSIGDSLSPLDNNIRISLIKKNGEILFDTVESPNQMENHLQRTEIQEALKNGAGESLRYSSTLEKNTYYYAILLGDNSVLRVALETNNIFSVFLTILPSVCIAILISLSISIVISFFLSKKILYPIEDITKNMDNLFLGRDLNIVNIYDEFLPFIRTLVKQREEINLQIEDISEKANIMDTITTNMQEGFVLVDEDKYILSTNMGSIRLLEGKEDRSYISQSFITLSRNIDLNTSIDKAIATKENIKINIELNNKFIDVFISPILNHDILIGLVIFLVDSTKDHKADLIRREFSANVSHELKTPLTSINGYAEMIENGQVKGEDISKFASIIRREGARLLHLIDSIIELSRLESSSKSEPLEILDLYSLSSNIVSNLNILARDKDIDLRLKGNKIYIPGNHMMIEELVYNLLDNAIKYTNPGGSVVLSISTLKNEAIVEVLDSGIGIPLDYQDRIFERFFMVDKSRSKKTQSSGLGLSIVKHIVEYHSGRISLESQVNKGTKVRVTLPLSNPAYP